MKLNTNSNQSVGFSAKSVDYLYGMASIAKATTHGTFSPVIGNGVEIDSVQIKHEFINIDNTFDRTSCEGMANVYQDGSYLKYTYAGQPGSLPRGNYRLLETIKVLMHDPNGNNYLLEDVTSYNYNDPIWPWGTPGQLEIQSPSFGQSIGGTFQFNCGWDLNIDTVQIEISKNGSVVYSNTQFASGLFNINISAYGQGSYSVRARGKNPESDWGPWSNSVSFTVWAFPSLSLNSNIDPRPTKPIHTVSLSANILDNGGCSITGRKLYINGNELYVSGTNPFTVGVNFNDSTPPITYNTKAEVFWTAPNGQQGSTYVTGQCTYYGEQLEQ